MLKIKTSLLHTILIASLALSLSACEVGDDYQQPDVSLPQAWVSDPALDAKGVTDQDWWLNFHDPVLTQLIDKAATGNFDLKIATARIAEARARLSSANAALLPTGNVKGTATREANQLGFPDASSSPFGASLKKPFNIFETGFDASWELDLFGGNRRAAEAADAAVQSAEASRDDARVSLLAEVARTYVDIRAAQAQLGIVADTFASDKKSLDLARQRVNAGEAPGLDVTQAEAEMANANGQLPLYRNRLAQAEFAMDVLLGEQPGATRKIIATTAPIPVTTAKLVLNAPASVITQRPDIRVAERNLASATAQQGQALAKFFPDISLSGFFGAFNTSLNNLVTPANQSWVAGGSVIWPILSYGSLSANLDSANAQQQEAMANYQKTIVSALSDVERSLTAYQEQQKIAQATEAEVNKTRHARDIADQRYQSGLTSYITVLTADRTLYDAQSRLTQARADTTQSLIALYKSLGGGWAKKQTP